MKRQMKSKAQMKSRLSREAFFRAREFLGQGLFLQEAMRSKQDQIDMLRAMAEPMTSWHTDERVSKTRDVTHGEDVMIELMEARKELDQQMLEQLRISREIRAVIEKVPSPKCRLVLEKRYLCRMRLDEISEELNFSRAWVNRLQRRGIEEVARLLEGCF